MPGLLPPVCATHPVRIPELSPAASCEPAQLPLVLFLPQTHPGRHGGCLAPGPWCRGDSGPAASCPSAVRFPTGGFLLPSSAPRRDTYNSLEQASPGRDTSGQPPAAPGLISPATKRDSLPRALCQAEQWQHLLRPELIGQRDTALSRHTSQDRARSGTSA